MIRPRLVDMTTDMIIRADPATAPSTANPSPFQMAFTDALAVAAGMVAFGVALGVTVVTFASSRLAGLLGGALVYGGSAQLTAITLLDRGVGIAAATLTAAIVNLRLLLYSASLAPRFESQPRWFRWLAPHFIIDQTYLMSTTRMSLAGRPFRRYWGWLGALVLIIWTGSIALGIGLGPVLPDLPHLGLVGTALFVGLLVPRLTSRPAIVAAVVGGATAAITSTALPSAGIIAGALAGVAAALRSSSKHLTATDRDQEN
jgi:predicted branched-subunit amino acid permease